MDQRRQAATASAADHALLGTAIIVELSCRPETVSLYASRPYAAAPRETRMKLRTISLSFALLAAAGPVLASSFVGTTGGASSNASSDSTSASSGGDDKIVLDAREDAASFVASNGQIRSARLEAALAQLRQRNQRTHIATDMQLARLILAL